MACVLEELSSFLAQEPYPELEKTERKLKLMGGIVLEQFIKQVERLDIFTVTKAKTNLS